MLRLKHSRVSCHVDMTRVAHYVEVLPFIDAEKLNDIL